MNHQYLIYRILELIHEATGIWLDEESPLDFESNHEGKIYDTWFAVWNEFLCVDYEDAKKWRTVKDIVRDVERGLGSEHL